MPTRISADWLLTGNGDVIPLGAVLIDDRGRLLAVGPDDTVPAGPSIPSENFPGSILTPGLVNAHTHLELTGFEGMAPETEFADWIRTIIRLKAGRSPADFLQASIAGLHQSFASGVTTVADTGDSGAPAEALALLGGSGITYLEVFGPDPSQVAASLEGLKSRIASLQPFHSDRVRIGVSPHAPYSVSGPLYRAVSAFAEEAGLPIAVHVAESAGESDLLMSGTGPFAENWRSRGIPLPALGVTPIQWLEEHGVLGARTLCIHVVRADATDIARLKAHRCGVAHCPRSNARHGHGRAPLRSLLDAAIRVGVGTDSAVSVSPPDLLAEARAARALAGLDPAASLRLVMLGAASALGLEGEIGSLEPGKWADLAVFQLTPSTGNDHLLEAVLQGGSRGVNATFIGGRAVYRRKR